MRILYFELYCIPCHWAVVSVLSGCLFYDILLLFVSFLPSGKTHYKSCKISSHKNSLSHPAINLFLLIGISLLLFLNVANAIFASTEKFNADIFLLLVLSSWKLTSSCQCRLFSISQCSLLFLSIFCASGSKEDIKHLFSTVVPLFVFLVFSIYPKDCIFFHFFLISAPRKPGSLQQ